MLLPDPRADDYCVFQMKFSDDVHACVVLNTHVTSMYEQEILLVGTEGAWWLLFFVQV